MSNKSDAELTALINSMLGGGTTAADRALGQLMPSLRVEARKRLKNERRGPDVETDVLADTAVRRLITPKHPVKVTDRSHFMNLAKLQMNRKLIERSRLISHKIHDTAVQPHHAKVEEEARLIAQATLGDALNALRAADPVRYRVLVMRNVDGESWQTIADAVELTVPAVKYRHASAYTWLAVRIGAPSSAT